MFTPPEDWLSFLKRKKIEVEPKSEPYYEECIVHEGIDVDKGHFRVYRLKDGLEMVRFEE